MSSYQNVLLPKCPFTEMSFTEMSFYRNVSYLRDDAKGLGGVG